MRLKIEKQRGRKSSSDSKDENHIKYFDDNLMRKFKNFKINSEEYIKIKIDQYLNKGNNSSKLLIIYQYQISSITNNSIKIFY